MRNTLTHLKVFLILLAIPFANLKADNNPFLFGGDISALPDLEKLGATYRDNNQSADALIILHHHGMNLFRVRIFVHPGNTGGATQDLPMVLQLATRIKTSGAKFSLALHYSDTWADPAKQFKPADWSNLDFPALKQKVTDYTTTVLQSMIQNQTPPDIVEIGNETTHGMLWPEGKLTNDPTSWDRYSQLATAGIQATRQTLPSAKILIHIDSGGRPNIPQWFFAELTKHTTDFDIIGLSFYPVWKDSLPTLKTNLQDLAPFKKDILIIETSYPYKSIKPTPECTWPMTPAGQKQFLDDLTAILSPNPRALGIVWWYPEAQPLHQNKSYHGGAEALFDPQGNPLPALSPPH